MILGSTVRTFTNKSDYFYDLCCVVVHLQHRTDVLVLYPTLYSSNCNQAGREAKYDRANPVTLTTEVVGSSLYLNIFDVKQSEDSLDSCNRRVYIESKLELVH